MSRQRLIERLKWYYPLEKLHTFVTFPVLLIYLLYQNPIQNMILLSYGLLVCIFILYQGQLYWKLKLNRLTGKQIDQEKNIAFFKKSKRLNWIWISLMPIILLIQLYLQDWNINSNNLFWWAILANVFAILEHLNYYYRQLMVDNMYDFKYLLRNKKLKTASLAKDLREEKI